ncbi:hypothetical protein FJY93_03445 [Candidatus Kaiserbacteria bacterium]|nr:hypothetical protein [Candidatus Kaiserbacteria bacterium]
MARLSPHFFTEHYRSLIHTVRYGIKYARLRIFLALLGIFERTTDTVITFRTRPLYAKDINHVADELLNTPRFAIVLQGPIMKKYDFTLETVRIYKKVYPGLTVIVSTWDNEDPLYLDRIRAAGAEVLTNTQPTYRGIWNINLQIISARSGIMRAKELGIPYTIKSRTDQRIYERNIRETLYNLISYFPPTKESGLHKRLVVCHEAYKHYNGYFPDMFMCGDTEDLLEYWSAPLLKKEAKYSAFISELYLSYSFRRRKNWPIPRSVQAIWETYRDCMIVLNWNDIDLLWLKYDYFWERRYTHKQRYRQITLANLFVELHFIEWFNIFANMGNKVVSPIHTDKFEDFLKTIHFSEYERNYEDQGHHL